MACLTWSAVAELTAWPSERDCVVLTTVPSGASIWDTKNGSMTTPLLAIAAAITQFCITVVCGPGVWSMPTGWPAPAQAVSHSVISDGSAMMEAAVVRS